jgi:5-methylcytosine-specific restriction endonuclease McrA
MPSIPKTQCAEYQCKAPSIKGSVYCVEHAPIVKTSQDRKTFSAHYNTSAWLSIRKRQLSIQPLCQACLLDGQVTSANHVDHVFPWSAIGEHAFGCNLFQSLCETHHGVKSGLEKKGIFRYYLDPIKDYTTEDYAYIMLNNL